MTNGKGGAGMAKKYKFISTLPNEVDVDSKPEIDGHMSWPNCSQAEPVFYKGIFDSYDDAREYASKFKTDKYTLDMAMTPIMTRMNISVISYGREQICNLQPRLHEKSLLSADKRDFLNRMRPSGHPLAPAWMLCAPGVSRDEFCGKCVWDVTSAPRNSIT